MPKKFTNKITKSNEEKATDKAIKKEPIKKSKDQESKIAQTKLGSVTINEKVQENLAGKINKDNINESNKNSSKNEKSFKVAKSSNAYVEDKNPKKDGKKNTLSKSLLCIVIIAVVVCFIIIGANISKNHQELLLTAEISALAEKNMETDDFSNEIVKTNGDYAKVEKVVKDFFRDYSSTVKDTISDIDDEQSITQKILTISNYEEDGPNFDKSKQTLSDAKEKFNIDIEKSIDLLKQENIMQRIEDANVSSQYIELYRNYFYGDTDLARKIEDENTKLLSTQKLVNDTYDKALQMINFLSANKDFWKITDSKIVFDNAELSAQYNLLKMRLTAE